jgi:hypothetical protein
MAVAVAVDLVIQVIRRALAGQVVGVKDFKTIHSLL